MDHYLLHILMLISLLMFGSAQAQTGITNADGSPYQIQNQAYSSYAGDFDQLIALSKSEASGKDSKQNNLLIASRALKFCQANQFAKVRDYQITNDYSSATLSESEIHITIPSQVAVEYHLHAYDGFVADLMISQMSTGYVFTVIRCTQ